MSFFKPIIEKLAQGYEFELGSLPDTLEADIDLLTQQCPNIAYCKDFLAFQREVGGFIIYLDKSDFWVYSINSKEIFPMLTGEGDLIGADGYMSIADCCGDIYDGNKMDISKVWAYNVDELPFSQKIYVSEQIGVWKLAYENFTQMLEQIRF